MQYCPALRHFRSRIGSPTSDDERKSILVQFVRTDSDWCRGLQSPVGHSRTISCFEFAARRRATPSGSETQSRFAFPHSPPSKGTARRLHASAASFPQLLGCAAVTSWQRQTRPPKWNQAELTRLAEDAPTGSERVTRSSTTAIACTLESTEAKSSPLTRAGVLPDWYKGRPQQQPLRRRSFPRGQSGLRQR